ncbi:cation/H+ exchanger 17 [Actinidia rufa]|uniref:Cation/H+ exchanger 17 n=1 Tax=Actinidia rufa TaxID=165716 RepID=A0A7J0FQZ6_9ERIC|nr:cation/H+ exchanger 17 [Actinidia rufa]
MPVPCRALIVPCRVKPTIVPCSTIFVPRALSCTIVVPFFGGQDDREALAYGVRMAEHPGIALTVIKLVAAAPGKSSKMIELGAGVEIREIRTSNNVVVGEDDGHDESDKAFLSECMAQKNESKTTISFEEIVVGSKADIIAALKLMSKSNLFLVGKMPPIVPLMDRSNCQELGLVGNFLASSDFSTAYTIVVQHSDPIANLDPLVEEQDTPDMLSYIIYIKKIIF